VERCDEDKMSFIDRTGQLWIIPGERSPQLIVRSFNGRLSDWSHHVAYPMCVTARYESQISEMYDDPMERWYGYVRIS
jgi:hypothetical protein